MVRHNVGHQYTIRHNVGHQYTIRHNVGDQYTIRHNVGPQYMIRHNVRHQYTIRHNVGHQYTQGNNTIRHELYYKQQRLRPTKQSFTKLVTNTTIQTKKVKIIIGHNVQYKSHYIKRGANTRDRGGSRISS
jgi:hypothetical protein